jgi:hypothetical protein
MPESWRETGMSTEAISPLTLWRLAAVSIMIRLFAEGTLTT